MLNIPQETNPWPSFHLESYESFIQQLDTRCLIFKDIRHRWVSTAIGLWQATYTACSFSITRIKINGNVGIWSHHFMGNRWGNSGRLYFLGSKIIADGDCSHETKRCLLLGRKVMTNLDSILKSRDITLTKKVCLVKAMVFPVVMYGCESLTRKKAECQRIDGFEMWCWRRLLRVPWTARRYNQSILKEISPGCSLEVLMLKLKLKYFGHLMGSWLIGKDPDAGRDWRQEKKGTTEDEMAGWHNRHNGHEFE